MTKPTVTLVDDDARFRKALCTRLSKQGYRVQEFASGEDILDHARGASKRPHYVFIDHNLSDKLPGKGEKPRLDGIETTEQLMLVDPNMCIVVFSGKPEITEDDKHRARMAGARRYVYKKGGIQVERDIVDFITELEELRELRRIAETDREQRERIAATLQEVPVGTLLVDRGHFPWAANRKWREIEEKLDPLEFPVHTLAAFLLNDPIGRELIDAALDGVPRDSLLLCTVQPRTLKFLHIWARPVRDHSNSILACSLSIVDETGTDVIHLMPVEHRLGLIAEAILRIGYSRARIYRAQGDSLIGVVERGGSIAIPSFRGYKIVIQDEKHVRETMKSGAPRVWPLEEADDKTRPWLLKDSDFVCFPLFHPENAKPIGWITVDRKGLPNARPLGDDDINLLLPYAHEARQALLDDIHDASSGTEISLAEVWARIAGCTSPSQAMHVVLESAQQQSGCEAAFIRIRQGDEAVMVARVGEYPKHRPKSIPMERGEVLPIRVIQTGQLIVVQDATKVGDDILTEIKSWSPEAREAFKDVGSFAIFPLTFGDTIGAMMVQARDANHFTPERRATLEILSRVAAMAWIDRSRASDRKASETQQEMAFSTVHNLRQPIVTIRGALELILRDHKAANLTVEHAVEYAQTALESLERAEEIISGVRRYLKPMKVRRTEFHLADLVDKAIGSIRPKFPGVEVKHTIPRDQSVFADRESIYQIFEALFMNAMQALERNDGGVIKVSVQDGDTLPNAAGKQVRAIRIIVEDNGPGIDPKIQQTLFAPFVTTRAAGIGLGLAFIKSAVEQHNGRIASEPVEPHGARFVILLPLDSVEKKPPSNWEI